MAFDLVQYFVEQIETQKPELLSQYPKQERRAYIAEISALTLGKLVSEWKLNPNKIYNEINHPDELYIQEIARHLSTLKSNQSTLSREVQEANIYEIFKLQLIELKQLHDTGNHNLNSIQELLYGQIEHLSGQADDWVWTTNNLLELKGSKPMPQEELSLEATMKEFNQMVSQNNQSLEHDVEDVVVVNAPTWAKIAEPVVAIVILWVLLDQVMKVFA
ncbi:MULTISPECIES: hypothetical protein [Acinetobacter]|jgi:hypothetical protein|uniref:Uncharacterized protein n=3 Tax=Acinetobacter schindleri TaxID=108981 RepID=N9AJG3_9GAMM|nr:MULTISPECIES: hypothetical protein [Acinetobacter]EIM39592.1 hypothetical protein HADU_05840 [Acinetobacter sp. HA]ENV11853.1 hypothetical protein F965_03345 [Acinetobacter schindleri NIPH 900]ENV43825.1 hypothetical protein F955_01704 [Acinetobacter schindleri CIP 107287]ENX02350.1 hypothetical protein F899_00876 [Acinetobacter sp. CIP 101934]KMV00770.1 hypothetical protein ACS72_02415 [Acinetobacter sp. VT 511]